MVSSDHLLSEAVDGELVDDMLDLSPFENDVPVELERMRMGIRLVPLKEVRLSFLLRTEEEMLSLRGR